jgi:hypothetical protein
LGHGSDVGPASRWAQTEQWRSCRPVFDAAKLRADCGLLDHTTILVEGKPRVKTAGLWTFAKIRRNRPHPREPRVGPELRYPAGYWLGFFLGAGLAGGFASPPFVLMSAKESFALNGY